MTSKALILRMIICAMTGEDGRLRLLYEDYRKKRHLYASIGEILEHKQEQRERESA